MKLYLLNALITPFKAKLDEYALFSIQKISQEKYEKIMKMSVENDFEIESALGHTSTVNFLKELFPDDIAKYFKENRQTVNFAEGDMALVFRITERGKKMTEWSMDDLKNYHEQGKTEFLIISRTFAPEAVFDLNNFFSKEE